MNEEDLAAANRVADVVLGKFDSLPSKCKPLAHSDNKTSWTVLSGIVLERDRDFTCVSLATGMKCLPAQKVKQAQGIVLHDSHAEILALRGFNHFLLQECFRLASGKIDTSPYVRWRGEDKRSSSSSPSSSARGVTHFTIREDLEIHMYCSEAPCGDCSMELTMANQEDSTAWTLASSPVGENTELETLKGRGYFSELGIVRRKPSRPDCPPSLSKSCSDKLALKQCTSLLSSISVLIHPEHAYLHSLVLPASQCVKSACDRAFGQKGRMKSVLEEQWAGGYSFRPFQIRTTSREFVFSRRSVDTLRGPLKSSNVSAVWTPDVQDTIISGILQGRKQADPRGGSAVCRMKMLQTFMDLCEVLRIPLKILIDSASTYSQFKDAALLSQCQAVKFYMREGALKGWVQNVEDNFDLNLSYE